MALLTACLDFRCPAFASLHHMHRQFHADPSFPDQGLTVQAATYIFKSIATSTRRTYSTTERHFIQFCLSHKLISPQHPFLPAHESTLIHFVTHLSNTVSYGTIKVYLAAINNLHIEFNASPSQNFEGDQTFPWHCKEGSLPDHLFGSP